MTSLTICARWFWTGQRLLNDVRVTIDDGAIVSISNSTARNSTDKDAQAHDVDLLLPGFANAHSHSFQRAFRGWVQRGKADDDFFSWRAAMYATANSLPPEGVQAVAELCFLEMAEAGITSVGEFHYLHHDVHGEPYSDPDELAKRVIAAALRVGVRITLLRCAYAAGGINKPASAAQRRFIDPDPQAVLLAAERLSGWPDSRVTAGIAPHSVRAVAADWLPELATWQGVVHAHVAEQSAEVEACFAAHGCSPLQLLADHGLVRPSFTAVHLTRPSVGDRELLLQSGASLCVCPSTELDLGDGLLPNELRAGIPLCVGTDSQAVIEPLAEARALELHGRGLAAKRLLLTNSERADALAEVILSCAIANGHRALGANWQPLAVGSAADLCAIDLSQPAALGTPPLCAAAFVATPQWVSDVWVAGQHIVQDGRHVRREAIMAAALPFLCDR